VDKMKRVPELVCQLYEIVAELEECFPGQHFTLDGHLVGSIGEVLAATYYGLELLPPSTSTHDARARDGRLVQIKATQRHSVALRSEPEHLLVLKLLPNGQWEEAYNGPGELGWQNAGRMQKNGQRPISLSKLSEMMSQVAVEERLPRLVVHEP
jgi:hypothetical protein